MIPTYKEEYEIVSASSNIGITTIMYGMGSASIAATIKSSIDEAEEIKQGFFNEFPNVEKWINKTIADAHVNGYVEDVWGRRRRLPDILLDKYELTSTKIISSFNPLLFTSGVQLSEDTYKEKQYLDKLHKCKYKKDVDKVKQEITSDGFKVKDNTGFVAQAERQCVNARIQGSAATMSKRAMINVFRNQELRELGFRLLIAVHDELIGECPEENKERCKELLSECMVQAARPEVTVPFKCDADDFKSWYLDVYASEVKKDYNKLLENNNEESAFTKLCEDRSECLPEQLKEMIL